MSVPSQFLNFKVLLRQRVSRCEASCSRHAARCCQWRGRGSRSLRRGTQQAWRGAAGDRRHRARRRSNPLQRWRGSGLGRAAPKTRPTWPRQCEKGAARFGLAFICVQALGKLLLVDKQLFAELSDRAAGLSLGCRYDVSLAWVNGGRPNSFRGPRDFADAQSAGDF